jgi:hypothetical protein
MDTTRLDFLDPFSLFEDPYDQATLQVFLLRNGDWTNAVHKALSRDTTRR